MEKQWQMPVAGRTVTFTAQDGPNGKLIIRANGRMVTQPLGPDEEVRRFPFDGQEFLIRRNAEGIDLEAVEPVPVEPIDFGSSSGTLDTPPGVVLRGRIYFTIALLFFIGSLLSAVRISMMQERIRGAQNPVILNGEQPDTRGLDRAQAAGSLMVSALSWEAFLAFLGMIGAGMLMRGFRWASPALETITWLMLIFVTFMLARVDRLIHVQMNAAFDPVPAALVIHNLHRNSVTWIVIFALITGGLLHLVGRRTVNRLYGEESY
jgi:hypothetical protein